MLTAAKVSETLGLRFYVDEKTALAVTNKRIMKKLFINHGIPTVPYRLIKSNFDLEEFRI